MKKIFYLIFILFCGISAFSQTNTWTGFSSNNWNTAANWSLNLVPTAAHDVVININDAIDVDISSTINSLTISGSATVTLTCAVADATITIDNSGSTIVLGSTLTLEGANGGGTRSMGIAYTGTNQTMAIAGTFNLTNTGEGTIYNSTNSITTVTGTFNNTGGTITSTAANLSFASGGTYIHALNGGTIPTATWNVASNCNITGITNSVPAGLTQAFGNFTWNSPGHSATINLNSALTTINGNFTINEAGNVGGVRVTDPLVLSSNTGLTLNVAGNMTVSNTGGAVWVAMTNGTAAVTINVGGDFNMSNATTFFDYNIGASQNSALIINVTGNYMQTGGFLDWAFTPTTGSVASELRVGGNFSHTGTALLSMTMAETSSTVPNGKITFNKAGLQTFTSATPTNIGYTNYEVASGSTLELLSSVYLYFSTTARWGASFVVKSGAILDANTNQLTCNLAIPPTGLNTFTLESGSGIITANVNGIQNGTTGTVYNLIFTRIFSSGANYTYDGTAIQNSGIFTTTPIGNEVNNLTVNNTAGNTTTGVTLQQPFAVANSLTLTFGHITSTATNLLTMNAGSLVSGQNYGASPRQPGSSIDSYVNGPMRKIGNTNFLFPLGKINAGNHFCGISSPALVTDTYTAEYIRSSATLLGPITSPGLSHVSNCEYWTITTTVASPNVNVTLSWNGFSNCNFPVYISDLATLVAAHFGTSWDSHGGTADALSNTGSGSLTWNGVTTFSPFSLGSTSPFTNPLPVRLVNVRANRNGDRNKIEWTNLTEADVVAYEVERSVTGTRFETLTSVAAKSNSNDKEDYSVYDLQIDPVTYYRIKIISQGGKISYSLVVKVTANADQSQGLIVYPNPVTGNQFTLQMNSASGIYNIRIYAANGQLVKTEVLNHPGGAFSKTIELPEQLKTGQYLLHVTGGEKILTTKLIKL
jgi:Secretion system C-terminal sorting domain